MTDFLDTCEEAARAGGAVLMEWVGKFAVREKGPSDLVTEADLGSQEAIRRVVLGRFPQHAFVGEEQGSVDRPDAEYRWIVDPLDGTMNYVHGMTHYCVSVALVRGQEIVAGVIFEPNSGDCYRATRGGGADVNGRKLSTSRAQKLSEALVAASFAAHVEPDSPELNQFLGALFECQGIRRTGSAALNMCHVAAGRLDGFWALTTKAWDVAAGALIVQEAGGIVTDELGQPFSLDRPHPVATAGQPLHDAFIDLLQRSKTAWRAEFRPPAAR